MQISNTPKLMPVPFAATGARQNIPIGSQIGIAGGRASYTDGFPPLTRTPVVAGGIPPFGTDFNGILNEITDAIRWGQSGGGYNFNADFSTYIGGYPAGSLVMNSTHDGYWLNTVDNNTNNPESSNAAQLTGWIPYQTYGITSIGNLGGSSIVATTLQASRNRIHLGGVLTANINLILPAWVKNWTVVNYCTGPYSVTVKTATGTGVAIPSSFSADIICDGINITLNPNILGINGRLINLLTFPNSGTYFPSPGSRKIKVTLTAGGASGGKSSSPGSFARSGGAGGTVIAWLDAPTAGVSIYIGSGGVGVSTVGSAGNPGGTSLFGSILEAYGGTTNSGLGGGTGPVGVSIAGGNGNAGASLSNNTFGGASYWGGGGSGYNSTVPEALSARAYGAGGAGVDSASSASGNGAAGICMIEEYA
ncbi:hypothetical protein [Atlantibacter hermannii]|uniref:hypothetical protein n=1 Tax=Atlantibacter hermannii TaxID=565 RepID=UPI0034D5A490